MSQLSRRDLFKSSLAATAVAAEQATAAAQTPTSTPPARERLLFDFGWRFHLG